MTVVNQLLFVMVAIVVIWELSAAFTSRLLDWEVPDRG